MPPDDEMDKTPAISRDCDRDELFYCYLADQPGYLVPARLIPEGPMNSENMIVNPDAWISWEHGDPAAVADRDSLPEGFYPHSEFIWIIDPATGMQTPFWIGPMVRQRLGHLSPGKPAPTNLPSSMLPQLYASGVLIAASAAMLRQHGWENFRSRTSEAFAETSYAATGQLIHPYLLGELRRYYRRLLRTGGMTLGDAGSPRRYIVHNERVASFFHQQLAPVVSAIAGVPVKPSYVYVAAYQPGADLASHTDREQCEYSITMLIDHVPEPAYQSPWPLYLETTGGTVAIWQGIGEGLLYRGRQLAHFRNRLPEGMASTSIFFHYVDQAYSGPLD